MTRFLVIAKSALGSDARGRRSRRVNRALRWGSSRPLPRVGQAGYPVSPAISWLLSRPIDRSSPCQIDDLEAMERLGTRLDAYSGISVPTVIVGGDRSPWPLQQIVRAVAHAIPGAQQVVVHGQGHDAHVRAPEQLARIINAYADSVLRL